MDVGLRQSMCRWRRVTSMSHRWVLRRPQTRIPCSVGAGGFAHVRHHIYGHGSHHGHGHGHGHPEGDEYEPWQFPKDADPRSFFQPPEPERPDVALHLNVELTATARELVEHHPEAQADIETLLHEYVDRLSACQGVLSTVLLQHYECQLLQPWPESQPEPSAGEPTGAWTLRCQVADHTTMPLSGPNVCDPLDLGVPQSLQQSLQVDERGLGPAWYTIERTILLERSRPPPTDEKPLPPPPRGRILDNEF